jgi:hypothetical protein
MEQSDPNSRPIPLPSPTVLFIIFSIRKFMIIIIIQNIEKKISKYRRNSPYHIHIHIMYK